MVINGSLLTLVKPGQGVPDLLSFDLDFLRSKFTPPVFFRSVIERYSYRNLPRTVCHYWTSKKDL